MYDSTCYLSETAYVLWSKEVCMNMFPYLYLMPIVAIVFGCSIAIIAILAEYREKKKYYESVVKALEVGKDPDEVKALFGQPRVKQLDATNYMIKGIVTIAVGIGLAIIGWVINTIIIVGVGGFLLVLGLAFLLIHALLKKNKQPE
jgi:hypothetical protein